MQEQFAAVRLVELAAHLHAEHHRELQALRLMHGHDPQQVFIFSQHLGGHFVVPGGLFVRQPQEFRQRLAAIVFEGLRPLIEHPQVRLAQLALGHRARRGVEAALLHDPPDKVGQSLRFRLEPPVLDLLADGPALVRQGAFLGADFVKRLVKGHVPPALRHADDR